MTDQLPAGILDGTTVLDLSEYIAGPYCGSLLADLGARVVKVEPPDGAEERRIGARERYRGHTRYALAYNRNKDGLAIDLRTPAGRAAIHRLVPKVDVVLQNFAPGVAAKLGVDYETLSGLNPRLIFVSSTAFGETGPYRRRKGFDIIAHAASGVMSHYADEEGAPRAPGAINYIDLGTAMFNALGVVSALYHRERTGEGQKIETSLFGTGLALQGHHLVHIDRLDKVERDRERQVVEGARSAGQDHTDIGDAFVEMRLRADLPTTARPVEVPDCRHRPADRQVYPYYRVYQTFDGYLSVAAMNRAQRGKLCAALDVVDDDVDVDMGNNDDATYERQKALMRRIEGRLRERPNAYWQERLEAVGVPCGQVNYRPHLYDDPQVQALGVMWELANDEVGTYRAPGNPMRFSKTPIRPGRGAPVLGEHSGQLLAEAGYTEAEIAELRATGVVHG